MSVPASSTTIGRNRGGALLRVQREQCARRPAGPRRGDERREAELAQQRRPAQRGHAVAMP
jgi:hypothetical protein